MLMAVLVAVAVLPALAKPGGEWMLPGEEVRAIGTLPTGVVCEKSEAAVDDGTELRFTIRNDGAAETVVEEGDFGFLFPFDSVFQRGRKNADRDACVAHVWCGGDVAWVWAGHPSGERRYYSAVLTQGSISSYSLHCDASRAPTGAFYRGSPVLNPPRLRLAPKGSAVFAFRIRESERRPDRDLMGPLQVTADNYSPSVGEEVTVRIATKDGVREERRRFDEPGEKVVTVEEAGRRTFVRLNVLEDLDVILLRRARFIARRQQAGEDRGPLSGAYLIYDDETKETVVGKTDHNAGRERLGMGVVMAMAARRSGDAEIRSSLGRHRAFILRELFDSETCTVYNEIGRDNSWHRNYNYPWMALYWLETWKLTRDVTHLRYAAGTLRAYYERRGGFREESPGLDPGATIRALESAGLSDEAAALRTNLIKHADNILSRRGRTTSAEVSVTHGGANLRGSILAQAWEQTHDPRYRDELASELVRAAAFSAFQPDYRMAAQPVRHWDGFWFGGETLYGDTFPQWLGALNGEMHRRAESVTGCDCSRIWRTNLRGVLSAFRADGFASCAYYPFLKETFVDNRNGFRPFASAGVRRGGRWDKWANDQDWSLYYAVHFLLDGETAGAPLP